MPTSEVPVPGRAIGRRAFLAGVVATAVAAGCSGGDGDDAAPGTTEGGPVTAGAGADLPPVPPSLPAELFRLGVASGDSL